MPKKTKSKVDNWETSRSLTVDEPKKTQLAQFRRREDDNFLTLRLENAEKFFSEDAEAYAEQRAKLTSREIYRPLCETRK